MKQKALDPVSMYQRGVESNLPGDIAQAITCLKEREVELQAIVARGFCPWKLDDKMKGYFDALEELKVVKSRIAVLECRLKYGIWRWTNKNIREKKPNGRLI